MEKRTLEIDGQIVTISEESLFGHWKGDPKDCPEYRLSRYGPRKAKRTRAFGGTPGGCALMGDTIAMRRAFPDWARKEHVEAGKHHRKQASECNRAATALAQTAALLTWGRALQIGDYRISGVYSDDFPRYIKDCLRYLLHRASRHATIAHCHENTRAMKGSKK